MRVLMVSLDGFDIETARRLALPTLGRLATTSAVARLDSGQTYLTGLTGEHLSNGLHPSEGGRQSAVSFDPATYRVNQRPESLPAAFGGVDTVVFDPCYFDLDRTPTTVRGIVDWGAHDPGGPQQERPLGLRDEITARFGVSPARPWLYGSPWPSSERCTVMANDLVNAVRARSEISRWLLRERLPDWTLALVNVSEAHSASEGFFHGADPDHPLAVVSSAPAAQAAISDVYHAIDTLIAELLEALPDVCTMVYTPHGMGINNSDVASMVLLGELLARWSGRTTADLSFPVDESGLAQLGPDESWSTTVWRAAEGTANSSLVNAPRRLVSKARAYRRRSTAPGIDWMPLVRHQRHWSTMRAFALPSYYDGRIRVNLRGREAQGNVDISEYEPLLDELETVLRACRDPRTGEPLISTIDRPVHDPLSASDDSADLIVHWHGAPYALAHPELGQIGPIPARRTGGHTSPYGAAFITGPDVEPADLGDHSPFDLLPTAFGLTGCASPWELSGKPIPVPFRP